MTLIQYNHIWHMVNKVFNLVKSYHNDMLPLVACFCLKSFQLSCLYFFYNSIFWVLMVSKIELFWIFRISSRKEFGFFDHWKNLILGVKVVRFDTYDWIYSSGWLTHESSIIRRWISSCSYLYGFWNRTFQGQDFLTISERFLVFIRRNFNSVKAKHKCSYGMLHT